MASVRMPPIVYNLQPRETSNYTLHAFCGAAVYGL